MQISHRFQSLISSEYRKKKEILREFRESQNAHAAEDHSTRFLDRDSLDKIKTFYNEITANGTKFKFPSYHLETKYDSVKASLSENGRRFLIPLEDLKIVLNHRHAKIDYFLGKTNSQTKTMEALIKYLESFLRNDHTDFVLGLHENSQLGPIQNVVSFLDEASLNDFLEISRRASELVQEIPFEKRPIKHVSKPVRQCLIRDNQFYFTDGLTGIFVSDDTENLNKYRRITEIEKKHGNFDSFGLTKNGTCIFLIYISYDLNFSATYKCIFKKISDQKEIINSITFNLQIHQTGKPFIFEGHDSIKLIVGKNIFLLNPDKFELISPEAKLRLPHSARDFLVLPDKNIAVATEQGIMICSEDFKSTILLENSLKCCQLATLPNRDLVSGHSGKNPVVKIWKKVQTEGSPTTYECSKEMKLDFKSKPDQIDQIDTTPDGKVVVTFYDPSLLTLLRRPKVGVTTTIILDPSQEESVLRKVHTNSRKIAVTNSRIISFTQDQIH